MGVSKSKYIEATTKYEQDKKLREYENQIKELKKQIEELKACEKNLNIDTISKDNINKFVEELLKKQDINITYLPDSVEKQIYSNILVLVLNLIEKLFL